MAQPIVFISVIVQVTFSFYPLLMQESHYFDRRTDPNTGETIDAAGFKSYFGDETYHAFKINSGSYNWNIIGVDSNLEGQKWRDQMDWLEDELQEEFCTIVYYHHPRFSSGKHGNNTDDRISELWAMLVDNDADLALSGHDHHFERFARKNADGEPNEEGTIQVIAGTGGAALRDLGDIQTGSLIQMADTYGLVHLNLWDGFFSLQFDNNVSTGMYLTMQSCH